MLNYKCNHVLKGEKMNKNDNMFNFSGITDKDEKTKMTLKRVHLLIAKYYSEKFDDDIKKGTIPEPIVKEEYKNIRTPMLAIFKLAIKLAEDKNKIRKLADYVIENYIDKTSSSEEFLLIDSIENYYLYKFDNDIKNDIKPQPLVKKVLRGSRQRSTLQVAFRVSIMLAENQDKIRKLAHFMIEEFDESYKNKNEVIQ